MDSRDRRGIVNVATSVGRRNISRSRPPEVVVLCIFFYYYCVDVATFGGEARTALPRPPKIATFGGRGNAVRRG